MRRFSQNVLLVVGSLLFAAVIAEVGLRIILPPLPEEKDFLEEHASLLHVIKPNAGYGWDERGFKNPEALERADVVAIGDSHTHGVHQGPDWPTYVAEMSGKRTYSMSVWGYGTVQYAALLDGALALEPELVLVGVFMGNDFADAYNLVYNSSEAWHALRSDGFTNDEPLRYTQQEIPIRFSGIRSWIRSRSRLYDFLAERSYVFRERIGLSKPRTIGTDDWSWEDPHISLRYDERQDQATLFFVGGHVRGVDVSDENILEGLRISQELLVQMRDRTEEIGATFAIVLIPTKESVYAPLLGNRPQENDFFVRSLEGERVLRERMAAFCEAQSLVCIDILPGLQRRLTDGDVLYDATWNSHPVAAGYRAYAEEIYGYLYQRELLR